MPVEGVGAPESCSSHDAAVEISPGIPPGFERGAGDPAAGESERVDALVQGPESVHEPVEGEEQEAVWSDDE